LKKVSTYATGSLKFLDMALMKQQISMRGYDRCLRLALSISALEGRDYIAASDIDKAQVLRGTDNLLAVEN
jgi:predicted ATPase with chaperone activity